MHIADQISLVAAPLAAAIVFDASPTVLGFMIACQSLGQLLGSIPFGFAVDRYNSRLAGTTAAIIACIGFGGAWLGLASTNLPVFGLMMTLGGFGIVLFVLTALSVIPAITDTNGTARANSAIEVPRSVASFAVPLIVGGLITTANAQWIFAVAAATAAGSLVVASRFPAIQPEPQETSSRTAALVEGGRFVGANPFLRAIAVCALLWNFAFSVLLVAMLPWLDELAEEPGVFGIALACFGLAATIGSWLAGRLADSIRPGTVLVLGPACSALAIAVVLSRPSTNSTLSIYAGFFLLGLGPSMWLVAQNTVRQLVTPRAMLGRVNAMIQTAIYGVRPLSAIAGGVLVGATTPRLGISVALGAFVLSTVVPLTTALRNIRNYEDLTRVPSYP